MRITGGLVIDGTGAKALPADVVVEDDRIAAVLPRIGKVQPPSPNEETIDATGCLVTPGFIDAHAHSDAYLVLESDAPSKLSQGITTEINGQCGGSAAPRYGEARLSSDWASLLGERLTWHSFAEYREAILAAKPAINTVQFVGHNTLRSSVMGYAGRLATPDELKKMCRLLEESLDEGAHGLTTGLIYQPGKYSNEDEVTALAQCAANRGGYYATHMRSEGDAILEAIDEVLNLVRNTGIRAEISHLKTSGKRNWHKIDRVLDKMQDAVDKGLLLGSDRYPYCAAGTDLDVVFPDWAGEGGTPAECKRLADAALRAKIVADIDSSDRDWSTVMLGGTWSHETKPLSGRTLADIATEWRVSPGEAVCRILAADLCRTGAFFFGMSEENLRKIYERPWIIPGSDASLRAPWGPLSNDFPHPRAYGTMPRFFRMLTGKCAAPLDNAGTSCTKSPICSREEAIARMTSIPARRFNLQGRGVITRGAFADIAIWREEEFRDVASYTTPHAFSKGIEAVLVNGRVAYRGGGIFTHAGSGCFL